MPTVLLITSDSGGRPLRNGPDLHFVVVGKGVQALAQMGMGGQYPSMDCGMAAVTEVARFYGVTPPSPRALEGDEGNTGNGCDLHGILRGLAACVPPLSGQIVASTPTPDDVANSAWGGVVPAADCQPYLDAAATGWVSQEGGWAVAVSDAAPVDNPHPTGGQPTTNVNDEDEMLGAKFYTAKDGTHCASVDGTGALVDRRWTGTKWDRGVGPVATGLRPFGLADAEAETGLPNIVAIGTQGDVIHYGFDGSKWVRDPSF